jgi:hypothetical protein
VALVLDHQPCLVRETRDRKVPLDFGDIIGRHVGILRDRQVRDHVGVGTAVRRIRGETL